MNKLTEKKRDDLKSLLEDHQKVTDAIAMSSKASSAKEISISNENNDNDFVSVELTHAVAKKALAEQRDFIERELAKLGVEIG